MSESTRIRFDFTPVTPDRGGQYAVEKDEGGRKRRYLEGIASGTQIDGHGERMTANCIESFQNQANSGNILLYAGLHGVNFIDDIGKLVKSAILPNGDWRTSFRLYDDQDGIGPVKLERSDDLWKQAVGLPPYDVPRPKGFSIEGDIPDQGIKTMDTAGRRVMDDVTLDGVVVVNRPAYRASVAYGVYKALGILPPWKLRKNLESTLSEQMNARSERDEYWQKCYLLNDALETEIRRIMNAADNDHQSQLDDLFAEYGKLYSGIVLAYPQMYIENEGSSDPSDAVTKASVRKAALLKGIESHMRLLKEVVRKDIGDHNVLETKPRRRSR